MMVWSRFEVLTLLHEDRTASQGRRSPTHPLLRGGLTVPRLVPLRGWCLRCLCRRYYYGYREQREYRYREQRDQKQRENRENQGEQKQRENRNRGRTENQGEQKQREN